VLASNEDYGTWFVVVNDLAGGVEAGDVYGTIQQARDFAARFVGEAPRIVEVRTATMACIALEDWRRDIARQVRAALAAGDNSPVIDLR